ncbi:MAG: hypothetical protein IJH20_02655 [Bacilli bacterium]|nr:hypothetical protein [Bacilli bacterium]
MVKRLKKIKAFFISPNLLHLKRLCKELDDLGYSYDMNDINNYIKEKEYYANLKSNVTFTAEYEILSKSEIDYLVSKKIVKPNLKKQFVSNKKKVDNLTFELHKNKHLLLLNGSMLELSFKECNDLAEKRKTKDYHFEFLLEDLYLQLFYEKRKIYEIGERILLLSDREKFLENLIELKNSNNKIIDDFMVKFHKSADSKDTVYQYEVEASNLLNEKKYSDGDISSDNEDLESTNTEYSEMHKSREEELKRITDLKEQISRVENIIELTSDSEESNDDKMKRLEDLKRFYKETLQEETLKWDKKKKELGKTLSMKRELE